MGRCEVRNRTMADWTDFARDKYGARDLPLSVRITNAITLFFPMGIAVCVVAYLWRLRRSLKRVRYVRNQAGKCDQAF